MRTILLIFMVGMMTTSAFCQVGKIDVEAKIDEIMSKMTLEEKVRMCHAQSKFSSAGVPRLGIPEIWMSDGPHGVRAEINWDDWGYSGWTTDSCTAFPALTCLAATFNPDLAYQYGKALGEEARYRKKEIILGPGVNIYRTPLNGRNFEYLGEDPFLASKLTVPYIKGVQENGVAACVKHYALNDQETDRGTVNVELSDRALYEIYLPAFKAAVQEGHVWSIMGSYNKVRGQYACQNELLLNKILKGDWGFDGVVVTDWGAAHNTMENALNGLDIEMGTGGDAFVYTLANAYDNYFLAVPFLDKLKSGEIPVSVVDDKVRRILRLIYRTSLNPTRDNGAMKTEAHFDVARNVAEEGIVLLKNNENLLPLNPSTKATIAVIGENATRMMTIGGGSSELKAVHEISPLQGIQKCYANATILHSKGYASGPSVWGHVIPSGLDADSLKKAAIEVASKADVVFFIGGLNKNHQQDCEGGDRESYNLPFGQDELIADILKVNKNVAVILVSGNAVAMPWINDVKAVMQAWYLGSETGTALANVLSGSVNPSGKLPFTFPVKLTDNGANFFGATSYPGVNLQQTYMEDILVGYRWFDTKKIKPLYEFGFGMSYTTFELGKVTVNKSDFTKGDLISLSVDVKNTGKVKGAEVVQLYAKDVKSSVIRPEKELKGFQKVQLEAGETKTVTIQVPVESLAFYDDQLKQWNVEAGKFELLVGTSSRQIVQKAIINVK